MSSVESKPATPPRAAAGVAFTRALSDVDKRCAHLVTLIDRHDLDHVVHVARSAADLWFTGRAACRRMVDREPENSPSAVAARRRLNAAFLVLMNLIKRAHTLTQGRAMHMRLGDIQVELVTAAAEPITKAGSPAEPPGADDTQEIAIDD